MLGFYSLELTILISPVFLAQTTKLDEVLRLIDKNRRFSLY